MRYFSGRIGVNKVTRQPVTCQRIKQQIQIYPDEIGTIFFRWLGGGYSDIHCKRQPQRSPRRTQEIAVLRIQRRNRCEIAKRVPPAAKSKMPPAALPGANLLPDFIKDRFDKQILVAFYGNLRGCPLPEDRGERASATWGPGVGCHFGKKSPGRRKARFFMHINHRRQERWAIAGIF